MSKKYFSWTTEFKSIIVVDNELFNNDYKIKLHITPVTADLEEQSDFFERLKMLFEHVFNNTITGKNVSLVVKKNELHKAVNVIHGQVFGAAKKVNIAVFGKGLVGKAIGDIAEVNAPAGKLQFEILDITINS